VHKKHNQDTNVSHKRLLALSGNRIGATTATGRKND